MGQGWEAIIHFLFENRERIQRSLFPHITAVLHEWSSSLHIEATLPPIAREAGLLSHHLLDWVKDSYRDDDKKNRKKVLEVILKTVSAIENEFDNLLITDVYETKNMQRRPHYVEDLCKLCLEDMWSVFLCKQLPDTVIKFAFYEWLIESGGESDAFCPNLLGITFQPHT